MSDLAERSSALVGLPVEFVLWPADQQRRDVLARAGVPRVLLVAPGVAAPEVIGVDEDWVRLPAADSDLVARANQLLRFEARLRSDEPYIDACRVLHRAGAMVPVTVSEAAIMSLLMRQAGAVVGHAELEREVWDGAAPSRDAIDAAIYRLRRRLAGLGMCIRSVRGRGFVLLLNGGA